MAAVRGSASGKTRRTTPSPPKGGDVERQAGPTPSAPGFQTQTATMSTLSLVDGFVVLLTSQAAGKHLALALTLRDGGFIRTCTGS